jgi:hypothetical protein
VLIPRIVRIEFSRWTGLVNTAERGDPRTPRRVKGMLNPKPRLTLPLSDKWDSQFPKIASCEEFGMWDIDT